MKKRILSTIMNFLPPLMTIGSLFIFFFTWLIWGNFGACVGTIVYILLLGCIGYITENWLEMIEEEEYWKSRIENIKKERGI